MKKFIIDTKKLANKSSPIVTNHNITQSDNSSNLSNWRSHTDLKGLMVWSSPLVPNKYVQFKKYLPVAVDNSQYFIKLYA